MIYTGPGAGHGRPFLNTQVFIKNTSTVPVRIHRCVATALDEGRRELFRTSVVGPDTLLRAGERMGSLRPGNYGGEVAPAGVTLGAVLAVARYRVSCKAYVWVGPFPIYEGD
jgi:hypothetical protein